MTGPQFVSDQAIDVDPPPAVKSLRSKFEKLALDTNTRRPPSTQNFLALDPAHARPRAVSSSESPPPDARYLRSSSSSSDLKVVKKPPPPPPRVAKPASPRHSASPLLRPVPPPSAALVATSNGSPLNSPKKSTIAITSDIFASENDDTSPSPSDSVASLRSKFSNSSFSSSTRTHTPRHSINGDIEHRILNQTPPAIPPRPAKNAEHSRLSPIPVFLDGTHTVSTSDILHSPFDNGDSDSDIYTVPLPFRTHKLSTIKSVDSRTDSSSSGDMEWHSTSSSRNSSESSVAVPHPPVPPAIPARPGVPPPPRPPLRPKIQQTLSSPDSHVAPPVPPPLPVRRSPIHSPDEPQNTPRLPARPIVVPAAQDTPSPVKVFGTAKLPPPPTRTIALGDKLPPARRPTSPSSGEDSGDEDDPKVRLADSLPDASHSSRRPPALWIHQYNESKVHVAAYTGHVAVSGEFVVVATHHHVKLFNLSKSDSYLCSLDGKDVGLKDLKVTSLEFRPAVKPTDKGFFLWLGTKDGHLLELDIRSMSVVGSKLVAHSQLVSHIFRHGRSMVTLDQNGKALIFTPPEGQEEVRLAFTQPKVYRVAEKQEFAKILAGRLWTSARTDVTSAGTAGKTAVVRVYDIFSPGSTCRSLSPAEPAGAVTSGTVMLYQPHHVYLGHEGGMISLWSTDTEDGFPQCIEVIKVSVSDVLSLEGVNKRLWAGGRKGLISAYDVTSRPWVVTNSWAAHGDLPVMKLSVDCYGIQRLGRLRVVSVGRDERIRFWDGLLGDEWVDQELQKREASFSRFRNLTLLVISWNVDASRPESLSDHPANVNFLQEALQSVESPDIIVFGLQEIIDLESRKMTAKNVLLGTKKKDDGGLSEKVSTGYKKWHDRFLHAVRLAMPPDVLYSVTHTDHLVGLFSCVLMKNTERTTVQDVAITKVKRGMGGRYGNKGAVVTRFVIEDSSICLINCHLAAGQNHVRQRNADIAAILEDNTLPMTRSSESAVAYAGGGDGSMIFDHEIVILNGDLNYRIDQRRDNVISAVHSGEYEALLVHDQLLKEMKHNRGFRLRQFTEGHITFAPTYKYDPRSSEYDTSEKSRVPAWCDRILWRSSVPARVHQLNYRRYEANISDHRPISAGFRLTIKSTRHDVRSKVKEEVEMRWMEQLGSLLSALHEFYVRQALI